MYTRQPFGPGGAEYRKFYYFVSELCQWPRIPSRIHFGVEGNQWVSLTQRKGGGGGGAYSIERDRITGPLKTVQWNIQ